MQIREKPIQHPIPDFTNKEQLEKAIQDSTPNPYYPFVQTDKLVTLGILKWIEDQNHKIAEKETRERRANRY